MTPTQTVIPFKAKAEGVFVRVPDGVTHISEVPIELFEGVEKFEPVILGFTSSLTESQWAEVVEMDEINSFYYNGDERVLDEPFYMDYFPKEFTHPVYRYDEFTATESGLSLMRSLGITEGDWIVILKRQ